ncbi:MAG: crosslink repair DNA glycosylase YcaQ family protein [Opitutaceae bacterium]
MGSALAHMGYVQLDPLNVCGRMHDLILRNRVIGYREGGLLSHVHRASRPGFEHFLPGQGILVAFPREAWRFLIPHMQQRRAQVRGYAGRLSAEEERLAQCILAEIKERGPLLSDDLAHYGSAKSAWGRPGRAAKTVLDKLFAHGRVLIAERRLFRRVFDLPERVLPHQVLAQPDASLEESTRWNVLMRLRQRRLVALKKAEFALVEDCVHSIKVSGCPALYCLKDDLHLVEQAARLPNGEKGKPLLLAPLDPVIYDRKLTERLWNFTYTWEVYTPAHKRVRGYYALPVLSGIELVGHVEPRADRSKGKITLISKKIRRGHSTSAAVRELGQFLGLAKLA